jgi:hypothetical protein
MPSGRFRIIAYSPKNGVEWSLSWQDAETEPLTKAIPNIVETLRAAGNKLQTLMTAEDEAEARRKKERQEEWERYQRREDERKVAQAIKDSQQQLAEIIESWGKAMVVERFFSDVEQRLEGVDEALRQHLEERLKLARQMMGSIDPLDFMANWRAPDDRYRSKYDPSCQPPSGGTHKRAMKSTGEISMAPPLAGFREFSTRDRREQASRRSFSIAVAREAGPTGPVCPVPFAERRARSRTVTRFC